MQKEQLSLTLTVKDIQKILNINRASAYRLVNNKDFPKIRVGKRIIIPRNSFLEWLDQKSKEFDNSNLLC